MFDVLVMVLATIGAGLMLAALAFVTGLIGVLVNAMILLFAGPLVDARLGSESS